MRSSLVTSEEATDLKKRLYRYRLHVVHMIVNVLLLSSACDVAAAQGGTLWKAAAQLGEPRCCLAATSAGMWSLFAGGAIACPG